MTKHHLDRRAEQLVATCDGPDDELLTPRTVCEWLGVSEQWLALGRTKGYGPLFQRMSSQVVRYKRADVREWLRSRTYQSTAEYGRPGLRGRAA